MEDVNRSQSDKRKIVKSRLRILAATYATKIFGNDRAPPIKLSIRSQFLPSAVSLIGALIGILSIGLVTVYFSLPLLIAPLGATAVLLFSVYDSPLAQPRNTIFGHVLAATIGAFTALIHTAYFAGSEGFIWIAIAVALSVFIMQILRLTHPPSGATAFLASTAIVDVNSFVSFIIPVAAGSAILVIIAIIFNNAIPKRRYPVYW